MLYVSGQISIGPEGLIKGKLGLDMTTEQGAEAAKICAINLLSQVKAACGGDLDRLISLKEIGVIKDTQKLLEVIVGCQHRLFDIVNKLWVMGLG